MKNTRPRRTLSKGQTPLAKARIGSGVSTTEKRKLVGLKRERDTSEKRDRKRFQWLMVQFMGSWFTDRFTLFRGPLHAESILNRRKLKC